MRVLSLYIQIWKRKGVHLAYHGFHKNPLFETDRVTSYKWGSKRYDQLEYFSENWKITMKKIRWVLKYKNFAFLNPILINREIVLFKPRYQFWR